MLRHVEPNKAAVLISIPSMITQAFRILEFDSLRALVRRQATTKMGKARIDQLAPADDPGELRRALLYVSEMIEARQRGARFAHVVVGEEDEPRTRASPKRGSSEVKEGRARARDSHETCFHGIPRRDRGRSISVA